MCSFSIDIQAAQANLQILGVSADVKINIQKRLSTVIKNKMLIDTHVRSHINQTIKETLRALGYYEPNISFKLLPSSTLRKYPLLTVNVIPGMPIKIAEEIVILRGMARNDNDYRNLFRTGKPPIGSILRHDDYENFKNSLNHLALRKGYFDAHYDKNQLRVSVPQHKAFWYIDYNSGPRYHFGKITFTGSQIREDFLQNLVPFKIGDSYAAHNLEELARRLSATGWFNSVAVIPEMGKINIKRMVPLHGFLTPRTKNTIEVGLGSATDVGPHIQARWNKRWLNNKGHNFRIISDISIPEKNLKWTYKIPILKNPLEQYYLLQGTIKHIHLNDTRSDASAITVSQCWDYSSGWQWAIHLHGIYDHFTQGNEINTAMLIYPSLTVDHTRSSDTLMMPVWGDSQHYSLDWSHSFWRSYTNFLIFKAHNVWIRTVKEDHRLIARIGLGWIMTKQFENIPPDLRFFAGGENSLRGYKYKGIAPQDATGKLTGASKLATSSMEYQYHIYGNWWIAIFIDLGAIMLNTHQDAIHSGAGCGIRWHSPIGPIKFDIARPILQHNTHNMQLYIGLGPEL
ncbi:autotransporter assembly complex protein TamA [Candidatus Erwinia haradaeae]